MRSQSWRSFRLVAVKSFLVICYLVVAGSAQAQEAGSPPPATQPSDTTSEHGFPTGDYELHQWLVSQLDQVPRGEDLKKITREELPRFHMLVDNAILGGEYHVETYPESPLRGKVVRVLARLLLLNHSRYLKSLENDYKEASGERIPTELLMSYNFEYLDRIAKLIGEGLEDSQRSEGYLQQVLGETLILRQTPKIAAESFAKSLEAYPEHPDASLIAATRVDALNRAQEWALSIDAARDYLRSRPKSRYLADVFFMLHKAYRHSGRLQEGLQAWDDYTPILKAGVKGEAIPGTDGYVLPEDLRTPFDRYLDRALFYQGFYQSALGNYAAAQACYEQFMDYVVQKEVDGQQVHNSTRVYNDYQAVPYHQFLIAQVGQKAPPLDLGDNWVVAPEGDVPADAVSLVVFCPVNRVLQRQGPLFERLVKIAEDYWGVGLRIYWVSYCRPSPAKSLEEYKQEMQQLVTKYELPFAAGLDVGSDIRVHRSYGMEAIGTANVFVIDREGNFEWRVIDPLDRDEGLIRAVLDRVTN